VKFFREKIGGQPVSIENQKKTLKAFLGEGHDGPNVFAAADMLSKF
jgi:hypothetical protein